VDSGGGYWVLAKWLSNEEESSDVEVCYILLATRRPRKQDFLLRLKTCLHMKKKRFLRDNSGIAG